MSNIPLGAIMLLLSLCLGCSAPPPPPGPALSDRLGSSDIDGYTRAIEPRTFVFPMDHGPHAGFRNEWWYFTGNVQGASGRRFGYQVTFFRIALAPETTPRESAWATGHVWMAHVALSDPLQDRHIEAERFARHAAGLAGVQTEPLRLWVEDWQITATTQGQWRIEVQTEAFSLSFELQPLKPVVLQGNGGLSQKSPEPGNASYYYSIPRLATEGTVTVGDMPHRVSGLSWLDREWSTSALADNQAGWDWFALQLDDGRDIMFYRLRRTDGTIDALSAGSLAMPDGQTVQLSESSLRLTPTHWWQSEHGARYPIGWGLTLGDEQLTVDAVMEDQLMDVSVRYWEGMVVVRHAVSRQVIGRGYLELAGY